MAPKPRPPIDRYEEWLRAHQGDPRGWFQCSCGEQFVTEVFDPESKNTTPRSAP